MNKILLVEDEKELRFSLVHNLGFEGYEVIEAPNGRQALDLYGEHAFDLVILDIMMPEIDGLTVLKRIRESNETIPILMLTAKSTEMDKVIGFELGADDYLTKPFGLGEFLARVKALLRRRRLAPETRSQTVRFLDIEIDFENYSVTREEEPIHFSQKEFQLLKYLVRHPHQAIEKSRILEAVWGYKSNATTRTIDTHIARIRRKLDDQDDNQIIQTVPTVGYKFVAKLES
ncbi:Response regulator transcription factor [Sulfidibacter corallicola]|uniref:Response regulator transcription factor n=1 Tax=Sulfidibacter corallicola TaxID=2818388 RepID=A0A8A4U380_SULCO|nr:response regulator transcription factor [Sulfidibacter corallicola]QTD53195.1 response regulator transcription factor [Sulfidibacter corallicola]